MTKPQQLGQGRRRICVETLDPSIVKKQSLDSRSQGQVANTREWFLWHLVKTTALEPLFVPMIRIAARGDRVWQQRVIPLLETEVTAELRDQLKELVSELGPYLSRRLCNKKGLVELHVWGVNPTSGHCQLFDYEHLDRDRISQEIPEIVITKLVFHDNYRPRSAQQFF